MKAKNNPPFIPSWLDDAKLDPYEFRLYCHILRRGECYESVRKMVSRLGMSRCGIVAALSRLVSKGFVRRRESPGQPSILTAAIDSTQQTLDLQPRPSASSNPANGEGAETPCVSGGLLERPVVDLKQASGGLLERPVVDLKQASGGLLERPVVDLKQASGASKTGQWCVQNRPVVRLKQASGGVSIYTLKGIPLRVSPEGEGSGGNNHPSLQECVEHFRKCSDYTPEQVRAAFVGFEADALDGVWITWRNRPVSDWRAALEDRMGHNRQKNANHEHNRSYSPKRGPDRNAGTFNEGAGKRYANAASPPRRRVSNL